jgi:hypothetical protein
VSAADLPASVNVGEYLAGPAYGAKEWRPHGPPQALQAGGVAGTRYDFTARAGRDDLGREVVAVRRGERVYFFTVVHGLKDTSAPEQFRRAVDHLLWK